MTAADRVYWLHALSPLHIGVGRGEGYIDLPLAREKVTHFPYVPGSSVKGVLADRHGATAGRRAEDPLLKAAFGTVGNDNANAGALALTDARLVCLPVRSLYGTFAWCTSRYVLRRLVRDLEGAGVAGGPEVPAEDTANGPAAHIPNAPGSLLVLEGKIYLEDLDLPSHPCEPTANWARLLAEWIFPNDAPWMTEFRQRFAVLPDDLFNFLCETGTEVQPHVRIEEDTKRVADGALWYEESLPAETVLAGLVWCDPIIRDAGRRHQILNRFASQAEALQIGGKATVGKGRVRCVFTPGGGS